MKRVFQLLTVSALVLSLAGCSAAASSESGEVTTEAKPESSKAEESKAEEGEGQVKQGLYTPGTISVTTAGRNGDMVIEVTFSEDAIEKVEVKDHQETPGISDAAIDTIPKAVVENQTLAVDAIAGATITGDAIIEAVTQAVIQAGGNPEDLQNKVEKTVNTVTVTDNTEVVVVGGGAAGMISAISLAKKGHDVILLEKMTFVGGATATCGGGVPAVATKELIERGEHTDPAVFETYIRENGENLNDEELTHIFAWNIGSALDYLREIGVEMNYQTEQSQYSNPAYGLYSMAGGGAGLAATLRDIVDGTDNIRLMLSTKATELITDEAGNVTGVKAKGADGTSYEIAAEAVVLATGTYSGDSELIDKVYMTNTINTAPVYLTGDGLHMAEKVGAAVNHLEWVEGNPNGIATSEGAGVYLNNQSKITSATGSIIVNQDGVRVMNEELPRGEQLKYYEEQENHALYLVMNENGFELLHQGGETGWSAPMFSEKDVDDWLEADSLFPVLVKGENIEEAAERAGINGQALEDTIQHYNEMVKAGEDTDFGHTVTEALEGPVYILELRVRHSKVLGGLKANEKLQIVGEDGKAIGNLYGAGEVVSGSQGEKETGMLSWCIASGYSVAENVSEALGEE